VHVHVDVLDFLTVALYVIIFGFVWRTLSARMADRPLGQAMSFIY
jgi:hypothetical protein